MLCVVKIWVSPVFDLILRQNISEEKSLLLERFFKRKNLQVFCLVIPPYQSSSLLQMCCCVFWPCTLHASFSGAGQLLLVLPPWPVMHPSELLPFGGHGEPRSGHQPESQSEQNRKLCPYPSSSSKIQTGSCSEATSLWDGSSDNSRIRLVVRWWWVVREWGCSVSYSHCSFESTVIKS